MQKAKFSDDAKAAHKTKQHEAEKTIKEQLRKNRNRDIKTTEQKRIEKRIADEKKGITNLLKDAKKPVKAKKQSSNKVDKAAQLLAEKFGLSQEQVMSLLAQGIKG